MSPVLASAAALTLYALCTAPLLFLVRKSRAAPYGIGVLAAMLSALVVFESGWVGWGALAPYDIRDLQSASLSGAGECTRIMQALTDSGIVIDRNDPARLVVAKSLWDQLPQTVREVAQTCAEQSRPDTGNGAHVEIVPR